MEDKENQVLQKLLDEIETWKLTREKDRKKIVRWGAFVALMLAGLFICIVWGFFDMGVWP